MGEKKIEFEPMVDIKRLSDLTGMGITFLESAKSNLGLPHYKLGRSVRFRLSEVNRWLKERHKEN